MPEDGLLFLMFDLRYSKARLLKGVAEWIDGMKPQNTTRAPKPLEWYKVLALDEHDLQDAEIARLLWPKDYQAAAGYGQHNKVLQRVADLRKAARAAQSHLEQLARLSAAK